MDVTNLEQAIRELEEDLADASLKPRVRQRLEAELADKRQQLAALRGAEQTVNGPEVGDLKVQRDAYIATYLNLHFHGEQIEARQLQCLQRYLKRLSHELHHLSFRGFDDNLESLSLSTIYILLATESRVSFVSHDITNDEQARYFIRDTKQLQETYDPDYALPDQAITEVIYPEKLVSGLATDRMQPNEAINEVTYSEKLRETDQQKNTDVILRRQLLVTEAIATNQRLVLFGAPGSGKSTVVRYMAWALAERASNPHPPPLHGWPSERAALPIILPMRRLAGRLATQPEAPSTIVLHALHAVVAGNQLTDVKDVVDLALDQGNAVIFFDGLDEVPPEPIAGKTVSRAEAFAAVQAFAERHRSVTLVITCRTRAVTNSDLQKTGWESETLAELTQGQRRHFAMVWYHELAQANHLTSQQAHHLPQVLLEAIQRRPRLRDLCSTPLLLTLSALVLFTKRELPRDRPQLYERILELLLGQWDKMRDGSSLAEILELPDWDSSRFRPLLDQLSLLAHENASSTDGQGRLARGEVRDKLEALFQTAGIAEHRAADLAVRCLNYFNHRSGLLIPDDANDSYRFAHLTLQEHCAGRGLAIHPQAIQRLLDKRHDDRWREPLLLGLGVVQQTNPALIEQFLNRLLQPREAGQKKSKLVRYRDLLLAAEIGNDRDWEVLHGLQIDTPTHRDDLRSGLLELVNDPATGLTTDERGLAGQFLGELGDPRPGVCDLPPPFVPFSNIQFVIGESKEAAQHPDEMNDQLVILDNFELARYLVTNAQFQRFIDAGGYNPMQPWWNGLWWSPAAQAWLAETKIRQPYFWDDPRFGHNRPNQPVVGVVWYEAMAFCAWLTNNLPDRFVYCLPSEAEWEYAARGAERRRYAWGDEPEPDAERANFDRIFHGPTPVGCFPLGTTPEGLLDLAGNVWEWTRSVYQPYPYNPHDGREESAEITKKRLTLRSGSWYARSFALRTSFRRSYSPDFYLQDVGFRLARHLPRVKR